MHATLGIGGRRLRLAHVGGRCLVPVLALLVIAASEPEADLAMLGAAKRGDVAIVRTLLGQGADVNVRQRDGTTALHWAAYRDALELTDVLLRAGASVNAINDLGVTPLWMAAVGSNAEILERLLKSGADPNLAPSTGGTSLMRAARTGSQSAVRVLLAHGADVNAREGAHGQTALMWAVARGHSEVVSMLIAAGSDVHVRTETRRQDVLVCCQGFNGDPGESIQVEEGGFTPILFAARVGQIESARLLLGAGAKVDDVTPVGATALVVAAHSGNGALAAFLLENGADPNAAGAGYAALHAAVLRADGALVSALLAHGADPNIRLTKPTPARRTARDFAFHRAWVGATPFWLAAAFHDTRIMRLLAAGGADPLLSLKNGSTALMAAARGESPQAVYQDGLTALRPPPPSEEVRTLDAVQLALQLGAGVNMGDDVGNTALHLAAFRRFNSVVQILADHGAHLEVRNHLGQTPLAVALAGRPLPKGAFDFDFAVSVTGAGPNSTVDLLRKVGARQ